MKDHPVLFVFLWILILSSINNCEAQTSCETSLNNITNLYRNGEWNTCKDSALAFVSYLAAREDNRFSSRLSLYCKNNIYQVYFYLIKSYLRLYDLDHARQYYFESLKKEFDIDFDSTDNNMLSTFGSLKKYSFSLEIGSISTDLKNYKVLNEFKLGLIYGFAKKSYLELSYLKRSFNQRSDHHQGFFGKSLEYGPNVFPNYNFFFKGSDHFIDLSFYNRYPLYQDKNSLNYLYFSGGAYVNYYLSSHINGYQVTINKSASNTDIINPTTDSSRYTRITAPGIDMDLKRLYDERFNYGVFIGYGSTTRLSNQWEISLEGRLTIGKNYSYRFAEFNRYKVGVDYFSILVAVTRRYNKIKVKKNKDVL